MTGEFRKSLFDRAGDRCEYCHLPRSGHEQRFSIDHIISRKHLADDSAQNLAVACIRCNLYKGTNLSGIDPASGGIVPLFNPRLQVWKDHFQFSGARIAGISPTGRATVAVLAMNEPERVGLRTFLLEEGLLRNE
jgi:hypothetical protein